MTQQEELTQRETDLTAMVLDLQAELEALREEINRWKFNGAEDMFGGGGFQRYGGALMRIDQSGIQIDSDDDTAQSGVGLRAIKWVPKFIPPTEDPDDALNAAPNQQYAQLIGNADNTDNWIELEAKRTDTDDHYAQVLVYADGTSSFVKLVSRDGESLADQPEAELASSSPSYFIIRDAVLRFLGVTSDFSGASDGDLWYRSDIDKFRARINGTTENLAREGKLIVGGGSTLTISSGEITVTNGYHHVDTEGSAANDDLDTINGGEEGQILVISTVADGRKVSVTENGNIALSSATMNLDSTEDTLMLMYSGPQSLWLEVSRSTNG